MKPKIKFIWGIPVYYLNRFAVRRLAKKIIKYDDEERYPQQWRNDYILKKAKKLFKYLNIKVVTKGFDNIPKNTSLIVANHVSFIDWAAIIIALENPGHTPDDHNIMPVFLVKKELENNPRFANFMKIIKTFFIDRNNPRAALKVLEEIPIYAKEEKKHIVIFPEGTRSKDGNLQEFKSGAFRIAKKAFLQIIPTTINNSLSASNLSRKGKLEIVVIFHCPIKPLSIISMQNIDIATKVKKVIASGLKPQTGKRSKSERKMT